CRPTPACAGCHSASTPRPTTSTPRPTRSPTSRSISPRARRRSRSSAADEVEAEAVRAARRLAELPGLDRARQALAEVIRGVVGELELADVAVAIDRQRHRDLL